MEVYWELMRYLPSKLSEKMSIGRPPFVEAHHLEFPARGSCRDGAFLILYSVTWAP